MDNFLVKNSKEQHDFKKGAIILVNKPLSWTSFDVVNKIRYALKKPYGKIKVGHAGTLDPLATGLLIICTGKATKNIQSLQGLDKSYSGTFFLGATTPSYDRETEVNQTFDITHITAQHIKKTSCLFKGNIQQTPPIYSAIKLNGQALYKKARKGEHVDIPSRIVHISKFDITNIYLPKVDFDVSCSKGTYIRSLAVDFGKSLHTGAYLWRLHRQQIGSFSIENAWDVDALTNYIHSHTLNSF